MTSTSLLLILTYFAAGGICLPLSTPFETVQEPQSMYDVIQAPPGEIEEYQPLINPWDEEQNAALLYLLLRKYSMEAGKSNTYRERNEKIKRNNQSRRGFCAMKSGCHERWT
ncbi:uncharacterized protein LOC124159846 [Ischnura elegans]|uniref:uncharacterized protein LOC124159846 n=1 Tax=Ischnura elegans TaxID=197161 RepID=UPI001ED88123|nr:uncharacterized protein LOC124159846 [Ischnura elegans]